MRCSQELSRWRILSFSWHHRCCLRNSSTDGDRSRCSLRLLWSTRRWRPLRPWQTEVVRYLRPRKWLTGLTVEFAICSWAAYLRWWGRRRWRQGTKRHPARPRFLAKEVDSILRFPITWSHWGWNIWFCLSVSTLLMIGRPFCEGNWTKVLRLIDINKNATSFKEVSLLPMGFSTTEAKVHLSAQSLACQSRHKQHCHYQGAVSIPVWADMAT